MENQQFGNQPLNQFNLPPVDLEPKKNNIGVIIIIAAIVVIIFLALGLFAGYFLALNAIKTEAPVTDQSAVIDTDATTTVDQNIQKEINWVASQEIPTLNSLISPSAPGLSSNSENFKTYLVGHFNAGKYSGSDLVIISAYPDGPAMYPGYFRFVKQGDNYTLLAKNSDSPGEEYRFNKTGYAIDNDYQISELTVPSRLSGPKGENLQLDQYVRYFFDINNLKSVFNDPTYGDVYTTKILKPQPSSVLDRNGFYLRLADGTVAAYQLKDGMFDESVAPKITWTDGTINKQTYSHTDITGCGSGNYVSVVESMGFELSLIGRTDTGDEIFAPFDNNNLANNLYYKNIYNTKYQVEPGKKKMSFKEFLATRPLFFWRDSFGRLIKFESTRFQPLAECGKPVIYLYPRAKTMVSVKLAPQGGFSYTEPDYKNGWLVDAEPNGRLTEVSSGKNYPYLFWEGRGGQYSTPNKGFTVKRAEVRNFLIEKLGKFNLNEQEINDFLEFWLPRMQEKPYYFITFLGTAEMDRLAPLTIDPKPDTIIRVLMDFTPLDQARPSVGFEINTPARNGFTVIEWGGVLRK